MSSDTVQGPLGGGSNSPTIGIGTPKGSTDSQVKSAILYAFDLGYRHVQTTISLNLEQSIGEAVIEAVENDVVKSRQDLFISIKVQYCINCCKTIIPDLRSSLEKMKLDYIDMYLIQWPDCAKEDENENGNIPANYDQLMFAWTAMELCQTLGLTKSIGVCNFSWNVLENLLKIGKVAPCINQVRMHQLWRDKKLREVCLANKISMIASSTLLIGGGNEKDLDITEYLELGNLKSLSKHKQKTASHVLFRWAYEQGAALLLESLSMENLKEIFDICE